MYDVLIILEKYNSKGNPGKVIVFVGEILQACGESPCSMFSLTKIIY